MKKGQTITLCGLVVMIGTLCESSTVANGSRAST